MSTTRMRTFAAALGFTLFLAASLAVGAWQLTVQAIPVDGDDIAGVVTSASGAEAGVWVIAETDDLPTKYVKIVVTDDQGRYVLPDLPPASYRVWVRGYGLVDSPKISASPGRHMDLTAVIAPDPLSAAQYYPSAF